MSHKPKCFNCGADTHVSETRPGDGEPIYYYRTRKCDACGATFTTIEIFAPQQVIPHKSREAVRAKRRPRAQTDIVVTYTRGGKQVSYVRKPDWASGTRK